MAVNFSGLYGQDKYADLIIHCGGYAIKVHKVVVCSASSVIAAMLDNNMKEAQAGIIEHTEFDIHTMKLMIEFVYKGTYSVTIDDPQLDLTKLNTKNPVSVTDEGQDAILPIDIKEFTNLLRDALITHARAYGIANYYNVEGMKTMAEQAFGSLLPYGWVAERNVNALLEVLVEVCKVTTRGDETIRRKATDLTTHALQHLHTDIDATFFLNFVHHEEPAVRGFVFEVLQSAAGRLRAYHRDYTALSKRNEEQINDCESERTAREENDAQNVKALAALRTKKDREIAALRVEHDAEMKKLSTTKDKAIVKLQAEKDGEINKLRTQKDLEIANLRVEKEAEVNKLSGLKDQVLATVCAGKDSEMRKLCTLKDQETARLRAEKDTEIANAYRLKDQQYGIIIAQKDAEIEQIKAASAAQTETDKTKVRELEYESKRVTIFGESLLAFLLEVKMSCVQEMHVSNLAHGESHRRLRPRDPMWALQNSFEADLNAGET